MSPKDIYQILRPFIRTVPIDFIKNARHLYHMETFSLEIAQEVVANLEEHEKKMISYSETYYKNCLDILSSKFSEFTIVFDGEEIPFEKN